MACWTSQNWLKKTKSGGICFRFLGPPLHPRPSLLVPSLGPRWSNRKLFQRPVCSFSSRFQFPKSDKTCASSWFIHFGTQHVLPVLSPSCDVMPPCCKGGGSNDLGAAMPGPETVHFGNICCLSNHCHGTTKSLVDQGLFPFDTIELVMPKKWRFCPAIQVGVSAKDSTYSQPSEGQETHEEQLHELLTFVLKLSWCNRPPVEGVLFEPESLTLKHPTTNLLNARC